MVWKSEFDRMTVDESLNSFVVGVIFVWYQGSLWLKLAVRLLLG